MMKLNKIQKILILASIFWEIFAYNISYYNYGHRLDFEKFMLASSPVILYWSVVWIWGFGTFEKLFKKIFFSIQNNIINVVAFSLFFIVGFNIRSNGNIYNDIFYSLGGGIAGLFVGLIVFYIAVILTSFVKDLKKRKIAVSLLFFALSILYYLLSFIFLPSMEQKQLQELKQQVLDVVDKGYDATDNAFNHEDNIKYSSKGNPNAQGLNIKLEYPNSWHIENINREDNIDESYRIIDMFVANSDEQVVCMLSVIKQPKAYSYDEWKKLIYDKELMTNEFKKLLFHNENEYGIKALPSKDIVLLQDEINGLPTVIANYTGNLKYNKYTAYQEGTYYILNYKDISINFNCRALSDDENQTKVLMDKYYPLVSSIANSINLDI